MPEFDLVIKGGTVVDGTGMPGVVTDIAVSDGRIAQVDGVRASDGKRCIDGAGLIVAPGFVDLHTHYDAQLFWDPHCTLSGWHGVTSVVIGNCGFGLAPCQPEDRERLMLSLTRNEQISMEAMQEGLPWDWVSFGDFLDSIERTPKGVNVASLAPLTPIMGWAMGGYEEAKSRRPTEDDIRRIQQSIHEAMDVGAIGWSTQRLGSNSVQPDFDGSPMVTDVMTDEEGYAYAQVLRERGEGRIQLTYAPIDDKMADLFNLDALPEIMRWEERLATISGRPVLHNTVQSAKTIPDLHTKVIDWLLACNARGVPVYGQGETNRQLAQFNTIEWNGADIAPSWKAAFTGSREERLAKLQRPEVRAALLADIPWLEATTVFGRRWESFRVLSVPADCPKELSDYVGRSLGEIAVERHTDVYSQFLDIVVATRLEAEFLSPPLRDQDPAHIAEMIRSGIICPGVSDGGAHMKQFVGGAYTTDFLTWTVRDSGALRLEEAHRALSALPAQMAGLRNRGCLVEGQQADIVIYDLEDLGTDPEILYETVYDLPGGDWRRVKRATGYHQIIVNGQVTFEHGQATDARPGRLLRHGRG